MLAGSHPFQDENYLPISESSEETAAPATVATSHARGATVLLVEDDTAVRNVTRMLLEDSGFRVLEASDGRSAERALESDATVDVVLLDLTLPDGPGERVLGRLQAQRPGLRVVLTSGYSGQAVRQRRGDVSGFVPKPSNARTLVSTLLAAIRGAK